MDINERLFFEHIAAQIGVLAKAYTYTVEEIERRGDLPVSAAVNDNVEYQILLKQLNRAIDAFKREMKMSLKDYYYIMQKIGQVNEQNAVRHLKEKLDVLHIEWSRLVKLIPEDILKKHLGHNYHFHANIKNLKPDVLLKYFEVNYALLMEEDLKE